MDHQWVFQWTCPCNDLVPSSCNDLDPSLDPSSVLARFILEGQEARGVSPPFCAALERPKALRSGSCRGPWTTQMTR